MKLSGYNIRPFLITVPEAQDRTDFIMRHYAAVGFETEIFNGISSRDSGLVTTHTYEVDNPGSGYKIGKKEVAGWLSFYMAWSAMNFMPETHFWTTEFDCEFQPNWRERVEKALKDVPKDFDLLFVGSCCTKGKPMKHIAGDVFQMNQPQCGHSTIIAKKALPVMLATQRKVYGPLDVNLAAHTLAHLKVFVILPRVCTQFSTYIPE
jgi:hypothetical protein